MREVVKSSVGSILLSQVPKAVNASELGELAMPSFAEGVK
jgi:hypothetical protein